MDSKIAITIRAKKLGVLIRDAREAAGKSKKETGEAIGISGGSITSIESGVKSPSLPELELLAFDLNVPIEHFWHEQVRSEAPTITDDIHIEHHLTLRDRTIGKVLAKAREEANLTYKDVREATGITAGRMRKYENGESGVPMPELEILCEFYKLRVFDLTDPSDPVGKWVIEQRAIDNFRKLPPELQDFVSQPVNRPYLELAQRLSSLSTDQLRAVAEGLLEITI
jgi:transcriptional regulator with XRE-family HTH domain